MVLRIRGRQLVEEDLPLTRYDKMSTEDLQMFLETSLSESTTRVDSYRLRPDERQLHLEVLVVHLEGALAASRSLLRRVVSSPNKR